METARPCPRCGNPSEPTPARRRAGYWACLPCIALAQRRRYAAKRAAGTLPAKQFKHPASYWRDRYQSDDAYREKSLVRAATRHAIRTGKLTRQPCEVCAEPQVEAHHNDYSNPLDVRWLCAQHHRAHHESHKSA